VSRKFYRLLLKNQNPPVNPVGFWCSRKCL